LEGCEQKVTWRSLNYPVSPDFLTYQAAWLADQGLPHIKEASMAKLFATETATRLASAVARQYGIEAANRLNRIAAHEVGKADAQRYAIKPRRIPGRQLSRRISGPARRSGPGSP
jgi:alkylation response protein AidB-like acyl-CoA dehydrogenase